MADGEAAWQGLKCSHCGSLLQSDLTVCGICGCLDDAAVEASIVWPEHGPASAGLLKLRRHVPGPHRVQPLGELREKLAGCSRYSLGAQPRYKARALALELQAQGFDVT